MEEGIVERKTAAEEKEQVVKKNKRFELKIIINKKNNIAKFINSFNNQGRFASTYKSIADSEYFNIMTIELPINSQNESSISKTVSHSSRNLTILEAADD
ncbi:hypothetical protein F8M41_023993 [Gigaspora margarita]|uniref:Uncharacterized protein n=1 Tax=Gigaspora margarita TaxID=4874 RepID=A0A8H4B5B8_GIGMA|nr:hypothetical protein F8M41_023993 [Gigaspora margarita]